MRGKRTALYHRTTSVLVVALAVSLGVLIALLLCPQWMGITGPFEWGVTFAGLGALSTLTALVLMMSRRIP